MIGIVLHKGGAAFKTRGHNLQGTDEGSGFPVTLSAEAEAIGHQSLDRQTGELYEAVQVFEGRGEGLEAAFFEERPHTGLDSGRFTNGIGLAGAGGHFILFFVFINQLVDFVISDFVYSGDEVADAEAIDYEIKSYLGIDLIAFGYGDLAHIVAESRDFHSAHIVPGAGGAKPDADTVLDFAILPVADDDFAVEAHPGANKAELAVAVCGLVEIHKVHIDTRPGQVSVELRMEVKEWFLQGF